MISDAVKDKRLAWTNKTGILMPVFRASNDNGKTFGKKITLNSTATP